MPEATAADVIKRLRQMHGHVGARDKATVTMAIGAITDLSLQLFQETHPGAKPVPKRREMTIRHLDDEEVQIDGAPAVPLP